VRGDESDDERLRARRIVAGAVLRLLAGRCDVPAGLYRVGERVAGSVTLHPCSRDAAGTLRAEEAGGSFVLPLARAAAIFEIEAEHPDR
jgi:hypothetical protein